MGKEWKKQDRGMLLNGDIANKRTMDDEWKLDEKSQET